MKEPATNNHYVTRSLTKPWEIGPRMLRFYDFEAGRILSRSSKSLFAKTGLWGNELEMVLKQRFEDPLLEARSLLGEFSGDTQAVLTKKQYHAAMLAAFIQVQRTSLILGRPTADLDLLKIGDSEIEAMVRAASQKYDLLHLYLPAERPMCMPETGFFPFYYPDPQQVFSFTSDIVTPLTPTTCLFLVDRENYSKDALFSNLGSMWLYSVGLVASTRRIVIPPTSTDPDHENLVAAQIVRTRENAKDLILKYRSLYCLAIHQLLKHGAILNWQPSDRCSDIHTL